MSNPLAQDGDGARVIHSPNPNPQPYENIIITSRYTWWNFIFLNLWEQFHRFANIYFLFCAIIQAVPQISQLDPVTGFLYVLLMLSITAIKNGFEDYKKHKADETINTRIAKVVNRDGSVVDEEWQHLNVGQLVYIENDCTFPADVVMLYSQSTDGRCRIETSALDGETNLKFKASVPGELHKCAMEIHVSKPTPDLTDFNSKIIAKNQTTPIDLNYFVPRGCILRKTAFAVGVIVYTGKDTKSILNAAKPHFKFTELDTFLDRMVIILSISLAIICIGLTVGNYVWTRQHINSGYLDLHELPFINYFYQIFSCLLILNIVIPSSIYSTLDLVRFFLSQSITHDKTMMDGEKNSFCRNSDLVCSIGRVTHIFSDKTGTITKNQMTFKAVAFQSAVFGLEQNKKPPSKLILDDINSWEQVTSERLVSVSPECIRWMTEHNETDENVRDFLLTIVLCHGIQTLSNSTYYKLSEIRRVFPDFEFPLDLPSAEVVSKFPYLISYQSASPDEIALIHFARECGYILYNTTSTTVSVIINRKLTVYKRPVIFEFNSKRKRMSVLVQKQDDEDSTIMMYMKGADSTVLPRSECHPDFVKTLDQISDKGLRTLTFARRPLNATDKDLFDRYKEAMESVENRQQQLKELADDAEQGLEVFGFSGVDDELQDDVRITLHRLRHANIKIWMLTGDKLDTALNIAQTSGLCDKSQKIVVITMDDVENHYSRLADLDLNKTLVAIDGCNLNKILASDENVIKEFYSYAEECVSVVCARCEPQQKGNIVRAFMTMHPSKGALAIGDGSNDVDMLRAANVGVGVEGREGSEAVMSSDFSIPSFKHLAKLLLVHGRWCANRCALLTLLTFYKNTMMALQQIYYGFFNGFSATSALDSLYISMYNTILTVPQLLFICIFEEDVTARYVLAVPQVYMETQEKGGLSIISVVMW